MDGLYFTDVSVLSNKLDRINNSLVTLNVILLSRLSTEEIEKFKIFYNEISKEFKSREQNTPNNEEKSSEN